MSYPLLPNTRVPKKFKCPLRDEGGVLVTMNENRQRGCELCYDARPISGLVLTDSEKETTGIWKKTCFKYLVCKHDECPYHELDKYKTYAEYERKSRFSIPDLFRLIGNDF